MSIYPVEQELVEDFCSNRSWRYTTVVTGFADIPLLGNGDDGCCNPCIRDYSIDKSSVLDPISP